MTGKGARSRSARVGLRVHSSRVIHLSLPPVPSASSLIPAMTAAPFHGSHPTSTSFCPITHCTSSPAPLPPVSVVSISGGSVCASTVDA